MPLPSVIGGAAAVLLAGGLYMGLVGSPPDAFQGDYVRIMYVHVPSAFVAYLAVGTAFVASILYLWRGRENYDRVAHSAGELAVLFTGLALAGGMIWGKPVWGTWWTWDARLVTTAILFLIFIGYLLVRELTEDRRRGARLAAVVAIVGALDIPVIHYSDAGRAADQPARLHAPLRLPAPAAGAPGGARGGARGRRRRMSPAVAIALAYTVVGGGILFYLLRLRRRLRRVETELRAAAGAAGPGEPLAVR